MTREPLTQLVQQLRRTVEADALDATPDVDLLGAFRRHRDPIAFEALVRRHGPRVLAACRKVLADPADVEDAFQATFLVLMRNPGAVRNHRSLASWLYGVAHRVSLKALSRRKRRHQVEAKVRTRTSDSPDLSWREACATLHEELDRLPDTYRLPLMLCYLEGLSRDEAATQLGRTLNSVKKSLEKGREQLRKRLVRRGVTLSVGLLAAVADTATADSSLDLTRFAVNAAVRPTANVTALASAIGTGLRMRTIGVCLAASILAVGVALGVPGDPKQEPPKKDMPAKHVAKEKTLAEEAAKGERIAFSGRVVDPDGKAVKGAKVYLSGYMEPDGPRLLHRVLATADVDGRFQFDLARGEYFHDTRRHLPVLAATIEGYGLGLTEVPVGGVLNAEIRLVRDEPIRGQIRDFQGKPVVGARIRLRALFLPNENDLATAVQKLREVGWISFQREVRWMNRPEDRKQVFARRIGENDLPIPGIADVRTGIDGGFIFSGIGKSRLAILSVTHPEIATDSIALLTESGNTLQIPTFKDDREEPSITVHRSGFQFTAVPTQRFEGIVTDRDTGKPIPGLTIRSSISDTGKYGDRNVHVQAMTDKNGFYRLAGLPDGLQYLQVDPGPDMPYFPLVQNGGRVSSTETVRMDFTLKRAQWVTGRVIDERTREPAGLAKISYYPARGNTSVKDYYIEADWPATRLGFGVTGETWTDREGRFRIAAVPGPGWLAVSNSDQAYVPATERNLQGDETNRITPAAMDLPSEESWGMATESFHAVAAVKVRQDQPAAYTLTIDRGITVSIRTTDMDGKRLAGAILLPSGSRRDKRSNPKPEDSTECRTVNPLCPPPLILFHPERSLGALYQPKVGDAGPWNVKLFPTASVTGILVRADGKPYRNVRLRLSYKYPGRSDVRDWMTRELPDNNAKTDEDGRFTFNHIIGEVEYEFFPILTDRPNTLLEEAVQFTARTGEKKDLGTIKPAPLRR